MSLITKADLESRLTPAEIERYSQGNDAKIADSIAQAEDAVRSAALNVFTSASWDSMTSSQLPPEAKTHLVSHAIDLLSSGNERLPDIETKAADAAKWRGWLTGDTVRCFDGILVKISSSTGSDRVRMGAPRRNVMDIDGRCRGGLGFNDPAI